MLQNGSQASSGSIIMNGFGALTNQRVEYTFVHEIENPFTDVPEDAFFYGPVMWAISNGLTPCNRAQVVTFLYRAYN